MSTAESISGSQDDPQPSPEPSSSTAGSEPAPAEDGAVPLPNGEDGWFERLKLILGFRGPGTLRESIEDALARDEQEHHQFTPEERLLLRNILRLREVRVDDVMVPRADIDAVEEGTPLSEIIVLFRESGHSRMPVYRETLDDPRGMVHIKDLMAALTDQMVGGPAGDSEPGGPTDNPENARQADHGSDVAVAPPAGPKPASESAGRPSISGAEASFNLCDIDLDQPLSEAGLVRPVLFVPPSMPAPDLMAKMQAARMQMALVIDEYGGTDGLVSLEDLVETVVGDIEDEHDESDEPMIQEVADGIWIADARLALDEAEPALGPDFAIGDLGEEVDTLGGLVYALIGRIPVRGELIASTALPGFEFEVLDADPRRIKRLRVYRRRETRPVETRRRPRALPGEMPRAEGERGSGETAPGETSKA